MSTDTANDDVMILDSIEKWLERDVHPHVLRLDHADEYPYQMVEQMKKLGLEVMPHQRPSMAGRGR